MTTLDDVYELCARFDGLSSPDEALACLSELRNTLERFKREQEKPKGANIACALVSRHVWLDVVEYSSTGNKHMLAAAKRKVCEALSFLP
ncbi:hypothetical protein [Spirosoma harenae]